METGHVESCRTHRNSLFTSCLAGMMRRSGGGGVLSGTDNIGWQTNIPSQNKECLR